MGRMKVEERPAVAVAEAPAPGAPAALALWDVRLTGFPRLRLRARNAEAACERWRDELSILRPDVSPTAVLADDQGGLEILLFS